MSLPAPPSRIHQQNTPTTPAAPLFSAIAAIFADLGRFPALSINLILEELVDHDADRQVAYDRLFQH